MFGDTQNHSGPFSHPLMPFAALVLAVLLSLFVLAKIGSELKAYRFIGGGVPVSNTVTVSGEGEVFAVPDIATFSVSVDELKGSVAEAQEIAAGKINKVIAYLKAEGVEERDLKTLNYSVYPEYEYQRAACTPLSCPPGKQVLKGYRVNQTLSVKVRDTKEAGTLLSGVGEFGVTNVSGLEFTIDDEDALQAEARKKAIEDAKEKAAVLSKDLGVRLVRIVSFSESGAPVYPLYYKALGAADAVSSAPPVPELPAGENKIVSNVSITYEIR